MIIKVEIKKINKVRIKSNEKKKPHYLLENIKVKFGILNGNLRFRTNHTIFLLI